MLVLAMVIIVPFVATPADNGSRGMAALAFEGMSILLLGFLLWKARWKNSKEDIVNFFKTSANLPVLLFLGLALVSAMFSTHKQYGIQEALRIGSGVLLYFTVAYHFRRSEQLMKLVDVLMFVAIGSACIGFAQYGLGSEEQRQATGVFGDHQLYGSFMAILLPIVGVVAISEREPNRQLIAQIAAVLTTAALLLSYSRSAWIGCAGGLSALGMLALYMATRKNQKLANRKHELIMPLMMLVVSVGFFLLISPNTSGFVQRATTLGNTSAEQGWQYRQQAWHGAEQMIKERPLTGFGLGQYARYQSQYTHSGVAMTMVPNGGSIRPSLWEQAHNTYLQTAAELGIPGLLLFIAVLSAFLGMGLQRVIGMDNGIRRTLLLGSIGSIVAFAFDGFGSPAWQFGQVSMFFWLILGIGTGCMRPRSKYRTRSEEEAVPTTKARLSRYGGILAALGLAAFLPTIALATVPSYFVLVANSGRISPKTSDIPISTLTTASQQPYQFFAKFTDPGNPSAGQFELEVTLCNQPGSVTVFSVSGVPGFMTGPNNSVFNASRTSGGPGTVTATYTGNGGSVTDTASQSVH
ncbi:MAG: rane protein [Chthonomonadaceae bacterium]|nr:rane protein [Chthonomonadaceae bacterium]